MRLGLATGLATFLVFAGGLQAQNVWQLGSNGGLFNALVTKGTEMGRITGLRGWVKEMIVTEGTYERDGTKKADSLETHYYLDPYGNTVAQERTSFDTYGSVRDTTAYRYDHRGRLHSTVLLTNGDTVHLVAFAYNDSNDRVIGIEEDDRLKYQYSGEGTCVTRSKKNGVAVFQACYKEKRLVSIITYNSYWGEPEELRVVLEYDGAGRPLLLGDAFEPEENGSHWSLEYDPYGNLLSAMMEEDTIEVNYHLYDSHRNWIYKEVIDNGWHTEWSHRRIIYAKDSSDFKDVHRLHDPFWSASHQTGYLEIFYPGGDYYLGDLVEGRRQGQGEILFSSGEHYEGGFCDDRFHGAGILHRAEGDIVATWRHGEIVCDHVEIRYANGDRYVGEFHPENDSCRYRGESFLADGGSYCGEYALEKYDGEGTLREGDGTRIEGCWRRGKPDGDVLIVMPNLDRHYVTFKDGRREAKCVIQFIDGSGYDGETDAAGVPNGYGTMTTANGRSRKGYFVQGKYVGVREVRRKN